MPTTSNYGLPYPDDDDAPNAPAQIQLLAEAVDLLPPLDDSGWQTTGLTAAAGWSKSSLSGGTATSWRRIGQHVFLRSRWTRTGGNLTTSGSGNISDETVASLPSEIWPPETYYSHFHLPGVLMGSVRANLTGTLVITDWYPTATIATGNQIEIVIDWWLD